MTNLVTMSRVTCHRRTLTVDHTHLVGKGVFTAWLDPAFFPNVRIVDTILWGTDIDLCPDALYIELTDKSVDEVWQRSRAGAEYS